MKKSILTFAFIVIVTFSYSQITHYFDRTTWQNNLIYEICNTEDFESFQQDTDFWNADVQCDGFTIGMLSADIDFGRDFNFIDVLPLEINRPGNFTTNHAYLGTGLGNEVILSFEEPVYGFFADYYDISNDGRRTVELYNDDMGMIDSFEFPGTIGLESVSHGIVSTTPISNVVYRSIPVPDGFGIDNIEISCPAPIPTLSQWGIIALSMLSMIFGVVMIRQRKTILA